MPAPVYSAATDQTICNMVQSRLIEVANNGASMTTTQFTVAQLQAAVNQAQQDFMKDTGCVCYHYGYRGDADYSLGTTPGQEQVALPQDYMDARRMAFNSYDGLGVINFNQDMPPVDAWSSDMDPNWESASPVNKPIGEDESLPALPAIYLNQAFMGPGKLDLLEVPTPAALSNTGVPLSVPPDFVPYVVWRALAILLDTAGDTTDATRARYANSRYAEGVNLAKALLSSPSLIPVG